MTMSGAVPGDVLVLTKALGVGIVLAAQQVGIASDEDITFAERSMIESNALAAQLAIANGAHACTDVTGFGLVGHLGLLLKASEVSAECYANNVPVLPGVDRYLASGIVPATAEYTYATTDEVDWHQTSFERRMILCDPQTSGGILAAMGTREAEKFSQEGDRHGIKVTIVGRIRDASAGPLRVI
jgi:selenide,water dikinase